MTSRSRHVFDELRAWRLRSDAELAALANEDTLATLREVIELLVSDGLDPGRVNAENFVSIVRELNVAYEQGSLALSRAILDAAPFADIGDVGAAAAIYERFIFTCSSPFHRRIAEIQASNLSRGRPALPEFESMIADGRIGGLKAVIAADPRLAQADEAGDTLLILAARYGARDIVNELLARGADVNHLDGAGYTPLLAALEAKAGQRGDPAGVLEDLLRHNADPNRTGWQGFSPLHYAVRFDMLSEAQRLLEHGADPNLETNDAEPRTPLLMAAKSGNTELLALLRKHGAQY